MTDPLRVILDTNTVIASGWKSEGTCRRLLDAIFQRNAAECYVSPEILDEYEETAQDRKFRHVRRAILRQVRRVKRHAYCAKPSTTVQVLSDPDDDKFLALAREVEADYLVTGDLRAFRCLTVFEGTHIVTPAEFLDVLETLGLA